MTPEYQSDRADTVAKDVYQCATQCDTVRHSAAQNLLGVNVHAATDDHESLAVDEGRPVALSPGVVLDYGENPPGDHRWVDSETGEIHYVTLDELRHLEAAQQARESITRPTHQAELERIDAKADPATMAALDALDRCPDAALDPDVAISLWDIQPQDKTRHQVCSAPIRVVGRRSAGFVIGPTRCKGRMAHKCPHCSDRWGDGRVAKLTVIFDALRGGDFDAPDVPINIGTCREDEWTKTRTRIRRHGHGFVPIPAVSESGEPVRLILTTDPDFGSPHPESVALDKAAEAFRDLTNRPDETRYVRFAKSWDDIVADHTTTPAVIEDDDPIEWIGIATKADSPDKITKAARRAGGIAGPVAVSIDAATADLEQAEWIVKVPPANEWMLLALIGFKSWAEVTAERTELRNRLAFEADQRASNRSRRRHVRQVSVAA